MTMPSLHSGEVSRKWYHTFFPTCTKTTLKLFQLTKLWVRRMWWLDKGFLGREKVDENGIFHHCTTMLLSFQWKAISKWGCFSLTFSRTGCHDQKNLVSVTDPDVIAINSAAWLGPRQRHSFKKWQTFDRNGRTKFCELFKIWEKEPCFLIVHLYHSSLSYKYPFLRLLLTHSTTTHQQFLAIFFPPVKNWHNLLHPSSTFSRCLLLKMSSTFCFSWLKNNLNMLSFIRHVQSRFHSTDVAFVWGFYLQSLGLSRF